MQDIELSVQKEGMVYQQLKRHGKEKSREESYANGLPESYKQKQNLRSKENNKEHIP